MKGTPTLSSRYCGYDIEGYIIPVPGSFFSWKFEVSRQGQSVFDLVIEVAWSDLEAEIPDQQQAIERVGQEGLHRVKGRLSLGWFKPEVRYRHVIVRGQEQVAPPLTEADWPVLASVQEQARYWLLKALYHIRTECPESFRNVEFDWRGVCIVTHTPVKAGRLSLDLLSENALISTVRCAPGVAQGTTEPIGPVFITAEGFEHFRHFEQVSIQQPEADKTVNASEVQQNILQALIDLHQRPNEYIGDRELAERLGLDLQEIQDHLDLMADAGYVQVIKTFGPRYAACPTSSGRMHLRYPESEHQAPSQGIHISINGSTVGVINAGSIEKVEAVQRLGDGEEPDLAGVLKDLVDATRASHELAETTKAEVIEHLSFLVEEITTPESSRKPGIAKRVFDTVTGLIRTVPALLVVWEKYSPMIQQALLRKP